MNAKPHEGRREAAIATSVRASAGGPCALVLLDLDLWACRRGVAFGLPRSGSPTDKVSIKALDGQIEGGVPRHPPPSSRRSMAFAMTNSRALPSPPLRDVRRRYDTEDRPRGAIGSSALIALVNPEGTAGPFAGQRCTALLIGVATDGTIPQKET